MASLKGLIEEIDIVNEKLERMGVLLAKAREDFSYMQDRVAEQRDAPVHAEQNGADELCQHCQHYLEPAWHYCPECGTPRSNRSAGG